VWIQRAKSKTKRSQAFWKKRDLVRPRILGEKSILGKQRTNKCMPAPYACFVCVPVCLHVCLQGVPVCACV
jgi:hypothetical protein